MISDAAQNRETAVGWFAPKRFALLLLLLFVAVFSDVLFLGQSFVFRDFGLFGYPLAYHHRQSFWHGEIPLWNPLNNCGMPFLAQWNTLALYPLSCIYVLLPIPWSLNAFCLAHLFLAGMGMYFLARTWTQNPLAASFAGVAFAFNGLALNCLMWPNNVAALGWMPWLVLAAQKAWREGGRNMIWAALIGMMQMLAGAPELIFLTWAAIGLVCLSDCLSKKIRWTTSLMRLALVIVLVACLSAVQLFPFFDLLLHSHRDSSYAANLKWSIPPLGWLNFFVPLFRCFPMQNGVFYQESQMWTSSYYAGIGTIVLAIFSIEGFRRKGVVLLWAIAATCLVLALGKSGYVYPLILKVFPALGFMRYPVKLLFLTAFAFPLLAAFGISKLMRPENDLMRSGRILGLLWVLALLVIGITLWISHAYPVRFEQWANVRNNGLIRALLATCVLGLAFLSVRIQDSRLKLVLQCTFLIVCWLDLWTHAPKQNPTAASSVYEPGLALRQLEKNASTNLSRVMLSRPATDKFYQGSLDDAGRDYLVKRLAFFADCNLLDSVSKIGGLFSLYIKEQTVVLGEFFATSPEHFADFLSLSHINEGKEDWRWTDRPTSLPVANIGLRPLFMDEAATLKFLVSSEFAPDRLVCLPPEVRDKITATNSAKARITGETFGAHRIEFDVETDQPSLLVLSQTFYHPWKAYVDDKPVDLWRANYAFQALEIPAHGRRVKLVYEDSAFRFGAAISGLTLLGLIIAAFRTRRAGGPSPSPNPNAIPEL